jgi:hypothetical protein
VEDRDGGEVALQLSIPARAFPLLAASINRKDLPQEGLGWLESVVEHQRPFRDSRVRDMFRVKSWNEWNQRTAVEGYDRLGKRDPKWDADAREGVRIFTSYAANHAKAYELLGKAIAAGCDDALVTYFHARESETFATPREAYDRNILAGTRMIASKYPAARKEFTFIHVHQWTVQYLIRTLPPHTRYPDDFRKWYGSIDETMFGQWGEVVTELNVPEKALNDLAISLMSVELGPTQDRGKMYEHLAVGLEKALPHSATPLLVKGRAYINWAWDARGRDWANTVTPEGWKLMHERLLVAQDALEKAWEIDPNRSDIGEAMLSVALGENWPREKMELWYRRAMTAYSGNQAVVTAKLYYLEPKWHGSPQEMFAFGHELLDERDWLDAHPEVLMDAHKTVAGYTADPAQYWRLPMVWADVQSVYGPLTKGLPDNTNVRSTYCYYACLTEHWNEAAKQFALLGNKAEPGPFGGAQAMEQFRATATAKAGAPD